VAAAAAATSELRPRPAIAAVAAAAGGLGGYLLWRAWLGRGKPTDRAIRAIDAVHAKQPLLSEGALSEQEYCQQVEQWVFRLRGGQDFVPQALQIAARAQHFERHVIPRSSYPEGRQGYLAWRAAVKRRQQKRLEAVLRSAGLEAEVVARASKLAGKDLPLAADPDMQTLEDATCLAFLEHEMTDFGKGKDDAKLVDILQKTWKKMSRPAHLLSLKLEYNPRSLGCLVEAIAAAEGLEATEAPMVAPRLPPATVALIHKSWEQVPKDSFGEQFLQRCYEEDPELKQVFAYPVACASNITKAVQMLLDQLEMELVPRLERMVHGAAALSFKFGCLRMSHMATIKRALVRTVVAAAPPGEKRDANRAWEAFFYSLAAVAAPYLVLADNLTDFAAATAAALPTPGGGPHAGAVAAHGVALMEMCLGITALSQNGVAAPDEICAKLREARGWLVSSVRDDVNAYCGLLSSVYGRGIGGREPAAGDASAASAAEAEHRRWLRRAIEVPLRIAEVSTGAAKACLTYKRQIKHSLHGDWIAGVKLLRTAVEISRKNVSINLQEGGRVSTDVDTRLARLCDTDPPWEDLCDL